MFRRCVVPHRPRVDAVAARIPAAEPRHDAQERVAGPSEPRALALVGDLLAPIGDPLPNVGETVALIGHDVAALGRRVTGASAGGHQAIRASTGST